MPQTVGRCGIGIVFDGPVDDSLLDLFAGGGVEPGFALVQQHRPLVRGGGGVGGGGGAVAGAVTQVAQLHAVDIPASGPRGQDGETLFLPVPFGLLLGFPAEFVLAQLRHRVLETGGPGHAGQLLGRAGQAFDYVDRSACQSVTAHTYGFAPRTLAG